MLSNEIRGCGSRLVEVDNASVAALVDWEVFPGEIRVIKRKVVTGKGEMAKGFRLGVQLECLWFDQ